MGDWRQSDLVPRAPVKHSDRENLPRPIAIPPLETKNASGPRISTFLRKPVDAFDAMRERILDLLMKDEDTPKAPSEWKSSEEVQAIIDEFKSRYNNLVKAQSDQASKLTTHDRVFCRTRAEGYKAWAIILQDHLQAVIKHKENAKPPGSA